MSDTAKNGDLARLEAALRLDPGDLALRNAVEAAYKSGPRTGQYQARDWALFDYQMTMVDGVSYPLRGPVPTKLDPGSYIAVLGSAAAYGVLCPTSYGAIAGERLGLEVLNLGHGGAGPEFYLRRMDDAMLSLINNAAAVVVEVMSSRSSSSNLYESVDGRRMVVPRATPAAPPMVMEDIVRDMHRRGDTVVLEGMLRSMQTNYVVNFRKLLSMIKARTVLFYFSTRPLGAWNASAFLSGAVDHRLDVFPQLVEDWMVAAISPKAAAYVQTVSTAGLPSVAIDRFSGQPINYPFSSQSTQRYYPSAEMNAQAGQDLAAAIAPWLNPIALAAPATAV